METRKIVELFQDLTTPHIADACLRCGVQVRCAPYDLQSLGSSTWVAGTVRATRHYGSVDVFLEALEMASPGEVLVVDNAGRRDEACVGDLVALETKMAGLAGIVIWGLHRDTAEILQIGLPVFSLGASPAGPLRLDPREADALLSARVGSWNVGRDDVVVGDVNGVLFLPAGRVEEVATISRSIRNTEHAQANEMRRGTSLRAQIKFSEFISRRSSYPALTFREHLRRLHGALEE